MPNELKIQSILPAPATQQCQAQPSSIKRKHIEAEPEIKVLGLECNRSLPDGISFVNYTVIKEPEYGIFFIGEFGNEAFQRWSDIELAGIDAMVGYLVMAANIKTIENAKFSLGLRKKIAEHLDQEKLKSKKMKLEKLRYCLD